jgi:hypothetical protein
VYPVCRHSWRLTRPTAWVPSKCVANKGISMLKCAILIRPQKL